MTATVASLIAPKTAAAYFDELAVRLTALGFPVTAWQVGNAGRTLARVDAAALADLRAVVTAIAQGGFLDEASGDWLTLLAKGVFDLDRAAAIYHQGDVSIACASGTGPQTLAVGAVVVTDGTRRWRSVNTSAIVVPSGESRTVRVRAEEAGDAYNVAGANISSIVTPAAAGLTVSAASGSAWWVVAGSAEESNASLRARCRARWSTLGRGANTDAYVYLATTCPEATSVTRARVVSGGGDGTLSVYVAQTTGAADSSLVAAVQSYINLRCPVTDTVTVIAATPVSVQVTGTVVFSSATYNTATARDAIQAAVTAYIVGKGFGDTVDLGGLYAAIYAAAPGILDVDLSFPGSDTVLTASQIGALGSYSMSYSP